jgi:hypothetical protein
MACWLMATGTTDIGVDRQSGIEEEQPAEIDSLRRNRRLRRRHVARKRLKQSLSLLEPVGFGLRYGCRRNDDQERDPSEAEVQLHHLSPSAINPATAPRLRSFHEILIRCAEINALGELVLPKPEAETDGGDDGKFRRAYPRGGIIDLRQVCRDDMSGRPIPSKGWVYGTADHTCDESIHGSLLCGTYIEE